MKTITTLAALLVLSGCASIVTVNPLYSDEEDLAQDLALEGAWQEGSDIWTISRNGDGYTLIDDDGDRAGGKAATYDVGSHDPQGVHRGRETVRCRDGLRLVPQGASDVGVETRDALLFTGSTADLRRILDQYGGDPRAFGETSRMNRLR